MSERPVRIRKRSRRTQLIFREFRKYVRRRPGRVECTIRQLLQLCAEQTVEENTERIDRCNGQIESGSHASGRQVSIQNTRPFPQQRIFLVFLVIKGTTTVIADNAVFRYQSRLSEIADASLAMASANASYHSEIPYYDWMGMAGVDGHTLWGAAGKKYARLDSLPERFVAAVTRRYPTHFSDPLA